MLRPGFENKKVIKVLISLTNITSEPVINALVEYYVDGQSAMFCYEHNNIHHPNFYRAKTKLEIVYRKYEYINKLRLGLVE